MPSGFEISFYTANVIIADESSEQRLVLSINESQVKENIAILSLYAHKKCTAQIHLKKILHTGSVGFNQGVCGLPQSVL